MTPLDVSLDRLVRERQDHGAVERGEVVCGADHDTVEMHAGARCPSCRAAV